MTIILASLITVGVIAFILSVRAKDLPQPEPVSPFHHLDERKAAIYENPVSYTHLTLPTNREV